MDCSLPGPSVHGILQARIVERVAISFSKGPSQLGDHTWVSYIAGRVFTIWATGENLCKVGDLCNSLLMAKLPASVDAEGQGDCILGVLWDTMLTVVCRILVEGMI